MIIVDGDDELLGRYVLKLYNAVYQKMKIFSMYSNYIEVRSERYLTLGVSLPYPSSTKHTNTYRLDKHYYSHLKSCFVDLFLLINQTSLKDK
jgi:hypothetical protein